jgi:hypothetical protein
MIFMTWLVPRLISVPSLAMASLGVAAPALAEVCDKERPFWTPSDGRPTQVQELPYVFATPAGGAALAAIAAALCFAKLWVSVICAGFVWLVATGLMADWHGGDGVARLAYLEGCRTPPILAGAALALISLGLIQRSRGAGRAR